MKKPTLLVLATISLLAVITAAQTDSFLRNLTLSGQLTSTASTGTAPLVVASTTVVPNLNAQLHNGLTAPASAILGLTDAQAPTNKTFTTASNGNTVTLLNAQANAAPITGTGAAATVYTYTLPANTVANLKGFRLNAGWNHSTGTASVTYNVTLNGVSVSGGTFSAAGVGAHTSTWTVLNTGATTGTAQFMAANSAVTVFALNSAALTGLSWTSNQVLTLTFNVANTDAVTPIQWLVELIQ